MTLKTHFGNASGLIGVLPILEVCNEQPLNRQHLVCGCRFFVIVVTAAYPLVI